MNDIAEPGVGRRGALGALALGGAGLAVAPALARPLVDLGLAGGGGRLPVVSNFPGKGAMLLQRQRAPLLETPFEVFDRGIFTPNDRFFVRWHYADIPLSVDTAAFRLNVVGAVARPLSLSLGALLKMPRVEVNAVNQCSGNSRGFFSPRVPGAQWGHGAMGNARWAGVRLRHVLEQAGVRTGAVQLRFAGLDRPPEGAPWYAKSLPVDEAMASDALIAFAMNGAALPLLNGFPLRLVVPGWYSTYWIKALSRIDVLEQEDEGFWMAKAYRIPAAPGASVQPGAKDFPTIPINRMVPRSFLTSHAGPIRAARGEPVGLRGIALGGDSAVASVALSLDGGAHWRTAALGPDYGRYSFRGWSAMILPPPGRHRLAIRCTNAQGLSQGAVPVWNPSGYMLNTIETREVIVE